MRIQHQLHTIALVFIAGVALSACATTVTKCTHSGFIPTEYWIGAPLSTVKWQACKTTVTTGNSASVKVELVLLNTANTQHWLTAALAKLTLPGAGGTCGDSVKEAAVAPNNVGWIIVGSLQRLLVSATYPTYTNQANSLGILRIAGNGSGAVDVQCAAASNQFAFPASAFEI